MVKLCNAPPALLTLCAQEQASIGFAQCPNWADKLTAHETGHTLWDDTTKCAWCGPARMQTHISDHA
jgi:hypothetical protein